MSFEISDPTLKTEGFDWQAVLDSWDVVKEQRKADFMEQLYFMYGSPSGLYTGLWQAFQKDAAEFFRDNWNLELDADDTDEE
jgi:hypothetical protein